MIDNSAIRKNRSNNCFFKLINGNYDSIFGLVCVCVNFTFSSKKILLNPNLNIKTMYNNRKYVFFFILSCFENFEKKFFLLVKILVGHYDLPPYPCPLPVVKNVLNIE